MSYDLRISKNKSFSAFADLLPLKKYISELPDIVPNGKGFAIDDPMTNRWMEIDLEVVSEEGDNIEESGQDFTQINCINLHILYSFLKRESFEEDYLQTALQIAKFLNWPLVDLQTEQTW